MPEEMILLADKNEDSLNIAREFFTRKGLQVETTTNVVDIIPLCQTKQFHIAILDLRLKNDGDERDRSGIEIAQQLRQQNLVPIIILTLLNVVQAEFDQFSQACSEASISLVQKQDGLPSLYEEIIRLRM